MTTINNLIRDIDKQRNNSKSIILQKIFKTDKGQYGYGDIFLGLTVPIQRQISKKYQNTSFNDLQKLINKKIHEYRLISLLILISKYKKSIDIKTKKQIYDFYVKNINFVNNWDLVDLSSPHIIGEHLFNKSRRPLYNLAKSSNLWYRRISIISTFTFIKKEDFKDTIKIAKLLLNDKHDLIHKAVGWMLREVGKRDISILYNFLDEFYKEMPRTMLRYAIEKLPKDKRKIYMNRT
jgi:3-methyladenine DNA glycosylase AlkD